jgi:hypothetical protein
MEDSLSEIEAELKKAELARARKNEGQARVCARRAAGLAARAYFTRRGDQIRTSSAYDLLLLVSEDARIPETWRRSAAQLILRVDEEFRLPVDIDLLVVAREFCDGMATLQRAE